MGAGSNGHTAGIMPYADEREKFNDLFNSKDKLVRGYAATRARDKFPLRITVTLTFLRNWVDIAVVFIVGEEKKLALEKIKSKTGELNITPARIIREMKGTRIYTDTKAW